MGLRSRGDLKKFAQKNELLNNPKTPLGLATTLRTRKGGIQAGYLNKLNRLQKKTKGQLKGIPGCGPTLRDWLTGY